jgi:hypothetical protein
MFSSRTLQDSAYRFRFTFGNDVPSVQDAFSVDAFADAVKGKFLVKIRKEGIF